MPTIAIACPHCGYTRQIPPEKIPLNTARATCPQCRQAFAFTAPGKAAAPAPTSSATAAPPVITAASSPGVAASAAGSPPEPPTRSAPPSPRPPRRREHRFTFSGSAGEYFGIWIVNLLLKVVTLGLYSAWAKVRKRRYFYGHTLVDGAPFDYLADPWAIFRGWCLGVAAFLIYSIGSRVSPILGAVFGFALFLAIPWVIVRARMFSARNSTHRNIRFLFRPAYREAYLVYAGLPLLVPFTLGLILPYMVFRQNKFHIDNSSFGQTAFSFTASAGDFYRFFLKVALFGFLIVAGLGAVAALLSAPLGGFSGNPENLAVLMPLLVLAGVAFYFFAAIYVQTGLTNLSWNATRLGEAQLLSTLRTRNMAWLYLSSAAGIVCSFGLLIPWAAVRLARYRCQTLAVAMTGELRALAAAQPEVGAAGEEFGDIFGIEVGLG